MKKFIIIMSIISLSFIIIFFSIEVVLQKKNIIMPIKLQTVFGIVFLVISICILASLLFCLIKNIKLPVFIEVNLFEIFILAILMAVVSFFLILKK